MREKQLEIQSGILYYELSGDKAYIVGYGGSGAGVEIPGQIKGYPVAGIGKKAFLSQKNLRSLRLPETIEEIGDWAFAYCDGLTQISLPDHKVWFGKAVFKECGRLERIEAGGKEAGIPELMAAAVGGMDAYYLLDLTEAGSMEWLAKWDARLSAILHTSDQEGYSKQVLCGEEDYGSTDLEAFTSGRRKEKARLAFLRLLFPQGISEPWKAELEEYLRSHTKGEPGEEAWQVLREEHGNDRAYYELFTELGCIHEDNFDAILKSMGEEYPEMKAFFMRLWEGQACTEDFFAGLEL